MCYSLHSPTADFTDGEFFEDFFARLPLPVTDEDDRDDIEAVFEALGSNLEIVADDSFIPAVFVNDVLNAVRAVAVETFSSGNNTMCLQRVIDELINDVAVGGLVQSVTVWREAVTTLEKIERYFETFLTELERDYDPANDETFEAIVRDIVRRSFCGRCTRNIPPLCINVCGALARAAYSPFFTQFRSGFQALWNVVARDVQIVISVTAEFFDNLDVIVDTDALVSWL